jgi:uncharacterized protein YjeT (DUF2065 family)
MTAFHVLLIAIAVTIIFEGVLPFLSPRMFRRGLFQLLHVSDRGLRTSGLCAIVAGIVLLYALRFI